MRNIFDTTADRQDFPFDSMTRSDAPPKLKPACRTLLLDGLWGNPARLKIMRRNLEQAGMERVETFAYNSSGFACLVGEGRRLAETIQAQEGAVNLVGYSMGGLVIRSAMCECANLAVHKIAFVNTPHGGSQLARWLPGIGISQMRPGCEFLARVDTADWGVETLAVWTPGDLMVIPATSARWHRATRLSKCHVPAHVWPLFSLRVHRDLAAFFLS